MSDTTLAGALDPIIKLNRDLINGLRAGGPGGVTSNEARFLVDLYYLIQKNRIRINNQVKGLKRDAEKAGNQPEPHSLLENWALKNMELFENQIKRALSVYVAAHPMAWFFEQTVGIGPVLAAGLLAHLDIRKASTAGHFWAFAGLDPSKKWEKGQKIPWNASLKTICWKIGDSFVKFSGREDCFYGQVYRERKAREISKNESGDFRGQAEAILKNKRFRPNAVALMFYTDGKLPPGHIDARARRWAVKLFLSHLQYRWWEDTFGETPAKPYGVSILNHAHFVEPPQIPAV